MSSDKARACSDDPSAAAKMAREFLSALRDPHSYNPFRNGYVLFGFLWGLPIPLFSCGIDMVFSGHSSLFRCLSDHPLQILFLLHPFLFGALFGSMGTIRRRKDGEIARLLLELKRHVDDLGAANEKLKELDHLKAEFMANVTHELKTPLVAIRGYNESILEERFGPLNDKQRNGLAVSMRNIERLQKLIDELLEFERIDAGEFKLKRSDFDLIPLIHAVLQNFQPEIERKRLSVQLGLPASLFVWADRERIHHVLLNLISNAVKFSPDGSAIGINSKVDDDNEQALLAVWDRGPGIPTAAQQYLFTRFWQADGSSRRKHGGTGLGLAIVKGILEAHGSTVQIISTEGTGTVAHFDLPLSKTTVLVKEGIP